MALQQLQKIFNASRMPYVVSEGQVKVLVRGKLKRIYSVGFLPHRDPDITSARIEFIYPKMAAPESEIDRLCKELHESFHQSISFGWLPHSKTFCMWGEVAIVSVVEELQSVARAADIVSPLADALAAGAPMHPQLITLAFSEPETYGWS